MTRPTSVSLGPEEQRLLRLATYASVSTASFLVVLKIGAWLATDSVSLLSSLIDSLLDLAASLVMLVAIRHALTPADREHRFGHGKAEPLAALGQSAFIAGSALFLLFEAVQRLLNPQPVQQPTVGIAVMAVSIVATFLLTRFQARVAKRSGSLAIQADRLHYLTDLLVNLAVIVAILIAQYLDWPLADPVFALAIVAYILVTAFRIAREAFDMLMDRELPEEQRQRIKDLVAAEPEVLGMHDLRTRQAGPQVFIQLHLDLDARQSLARTHAVADRLERRLAEAFAGAEVIIHQDPKEPPEADGPAPA